MTDNALPRGLIGGSEKRLIRIVEYDPQWLDKFQEHSAKICQAVGAAALRVEHIGSTSVPELGAKPIVDILLVVRNSADEASYLPALEAAGYVLRVREPEFEEHRMFRTPELDVHVHVFSEGSKEIGRYLDFRNRLRTNEDERKGYEALKRRLAAMDWPNMDAYAAAKGEMVEEIIARERGSESAKG